MALIYKILLARRTGAATETAGVFPLGPNGVRAEDVRNRTLSDLR